MENAIAKIQELVSVFGLKILAALAIFIIGKWAANVTKKVTHKVMTKRNVDPTIVSFVENLIYIIVVAFVVLASLGQLGVQTTSFVAIIGAAGLAIGLSLQGSLSNFAAGLLMLIFRPFKVDDVIEGAGVIGKVEAMKVFTTQLKTADNKVIIVPNAKLTSDNIINYSAKETRRVDLTCGIGYGDDIDKAKKVINDLLAADDRILKDPAPTVAVLEMADSSVNFVVRPWVKTADYWNVYFDTTESIKKRFDAESISIPFPQRDVHIYDHKND